MSENTEDKAPESTPETVANKVEETTTEATTEVAAEEVVEVATEEVVEAKTEEVVEAVAETKDEDVEAIITEKKVEEEKIDLENFDWDMYASGETYTEEESAAIAQKYEGTLRSIKNKELVTGKVTSIGDREVVINLDYKSEGVVAINEFRYNPDLAIGDEVELIVEKLENKKGQLEVSHKIARIHRAWLKVNECLETGEIITGRVKSRTKGGLIADVFGIEAFLPGSQIDVKPIRDYDEYVGKNMEFKVVKINHEFKNVVVSHKALIEAELEEQKKQIMSGLEKGQVLQGIVKNVTSYGVFVDLGGVDGLIHITDLSWKRIKHPEEIVTLDEKINVVILDFNDDKKRIALGLKQLEKHPWDSLDEKMAVGDKVKGKVVVMADYGAFVEIADGVEGLIHVSEMSWSQHLRSAQDFLNIGDEIDAQVLTLDREERKMSLGIKQLSPDPWEGIETKYPVGSSHKSTVRNFTNFGVFTELEPGIDGLIHVSDLSWDKKIKHPSEFCAVSDELEVIVLELDKENRKLSLGHKQLEEKPWEQFESVFVEGSTHQGTIIKVEPKSGAVVSLPYGIEGYAPARHLKKDDGEKAKLDEVLDFVILEFDNSNGKIILSHTRTFEEEQAKEAKKTKADTTKQMKKMSSSPKSTLGDMDALQSLKDKLEGK
jgi:small subunit ribosomal protein S1|tara:strand:- start:10190 stop:12169 length:1980 start_codon:yes stop_codon:yes gene_type:complete